MAVLAPVHAIDCSGGDLWRQVRRSRRGTAGLSAICSGHFCGRLFGLRRWAAAGQAGGGSCGTPDGTTRSHALCPRKRQEAPWVFTGCLHGHGRHRHILRLIPWASMTCALFTVTPKPPKCKQAGDARLPHPRPVGTSSMPANSARHGGSSTGMAPDGPGLPRRSIAETGSWLATP